MPVAAASLADHAARLFPPEQRQQALASRWGSMGSQTGSERSGGTADVCLGRVLGSALLGYRAVRQRRRWPIQTVVVPCRRRDDLRWMGSIRARLGCRQQAFGLGGQSLRGGQVNIDNLTGGSSGALAYSIDIERNVAFVDGAARPETALRVTHICRRAGDGRWQIVHRHADRLR